MLLIQVLCLVSLESREAAAQARALEMLLQKLEADMVDGALAGTCLDALLALLAGSSANQQMFLGMNGLQKVHHLAHSHSSSKCFQHAWCHASFHKKSQATCNRLFGAWKEALLRPVSVPWCDPHRRNVQVCSVLLRQASPSCQILCCKAINLLATHILEQGGEGRGASTPQVRGMSARLGQHAALCRAAPFCIRRVLIQ